MCRIMGEYEHDVRLDEGAFHCRRDARHGDVKFVMKTICIQVGEMTCKSALPQPARVFCCVKRSGVCRIGMLRFSSHVKQRLRYGQCRYLSRCLTMMRWWRIHVRRKRSCRFKCDVRWTAKFNTPFLWTDKYDETVWNVVLELFLFRHNSLSTVAHQSAFLFSPTLRHALQAPTCLQ